MDKFTDMNNLKLSIKQINDLMHCCGNDPFHLQDARNYINTGTKSLNWDSLCHFGLAVGKDRGAEAGGMYYHLTEAGYKVLQEIFQEFKISLRCGNEECDNPPVVLEARNGVIMNCGHFCHVCQEQLL